MCCQLASGYRNDVVSWQLASGITPCVGSQHQVLHHFVSSHCYYTMCCQLHTELSTNGVLHTKCIVKFHFSATAPTDFNPTDALTREGLLLKRGAHIFKCHWTSIIWTQDSNATEKRLDMCDRSVLGDTQKHYSYSVLVAHDCHCDQLCCHDPPHLPPPPPAQFRWVRSSGSLCLTPNIPAWLDLILAKCKLIFVALKRDRC